MPAAPWDMLEKQALPAHTQREGLMIAKVHLLFVSPSGAQHRARLEDGVPPPKVGEIISWGPSHNSWAFTVLGQSISLESQDGRDAMLFTMNIDRERPAGWIPPFDGVFIDRRIRR